MFDITGYVSPPMGLDWKGTEGFFVERKGTEAATVTVEADERRIHPAEVGPRRSQHTSANGVSV